MIEKTPEGKRRVTLIKATSTKIERHIKIRGAANPFDPKDAAYFEERTAEQQRRRAGRAATKSGVKGQQPRKKQTAGYPEREITLEGLSRMTGNCHVRF